MDEYSAKIPAYLPWISKSRSIVGTPPVRPLQMVKSARKRGAAACRECVSTPRHPVCLISTATIRLEDISRDGRGRHGLPFEDEPSSFVNRPGYMPVGGIRDRAS
jgi:hypothetical protein